MLIIQPAIPDVPEQTPVSLPNAPVEEPVESIPAMEEEGELKSLMISAMRLTQIEARPAIKEKRVALAA